MQDVVLCKNCFPFGNSAPSGTNPFVRVCLCIQWIGFHCFTFFPCCCMLINGRVTWQDNRDNNRTKQKFVNAKKHYGKNSIANWIHNELSGDENGTQEITKKLILMLIHFLRSNKK